MLPEIQLDKDRFESMTREMQNMISSICPAWTDYNAHDPGITLMELFAWLQEIQQYHMDQINEGQMMQYLKLLGQKRRGRSAALVLLSLHAEEMLCVKKNSRFYAGRFCFETERELVLPGIQAVFCACQEADGFTVLEKEQLAHDGQMEFYPFGRRLSFETAFYLGLDGPLPLGKETALSVRVSKKWPVERNRIEGEMFPLADLAYEYFENEKTGWKPLSVVRDESFGFLQDGFLSFSCTGPMEKTQIAGREAYAIRIVLKDSGYEVPPIITGLDFAYVPAVQKHTRARLLPASLCTGEQGAEIISKEALLGDERAECLLGFHGRYRPAALTYQLREGYAVFSVPSFAGGKLDVTGEILDVTGEKPDVTEEKPDVVGEKPDVTGKIPDAAGEIPDEVFVCAYEQAFERGRYLPDGDGFPGQHISLKDRELLTEDFLLMAEDQENPGFFNIWSQVEDFHSSGPEDRHYILDGEKGELIFGDGFYGMAPEGRLLIAGCAVSFGSAGNINPADFTAPEYETLTAVSRTDAWGGADPESLAEVFRRFERSQHDIFQAVTLADYEALAMRTPGLMLHSCRAIASSSGGITVAVMPFSENGEGILSERAARNIRHFLEERRLIGTKIRVKSPEYIQISVTVQMYLKSQYRNGRQTVEDTVKDFFHGIHGHMGEPLSYRSLSGALERLPCTAKIGYLTLEARGNGFTYGENGDILPPPDGVFVLKSLECVALEA